MERRAFIGKLMAGGVALTGLGFAQDVMASDTSIQATGTYRTRSRIDLDWLFHLGDWTEEEARSSDASVWRKIDIPHDWSIEGPYDADHPAGYHGAFLPGGIGWYRKELDWEPEWEGSCVYIDFDGIFMCSDVYINGHHLGHWPYGYTSFRYELTSYLTKGKNVLTVRVDNSLQPSARWYTGSGIYRHVYLTAVRQLHIGHWGVYVTTPEIGSGSATIRVQTELLNKSGHGQTVSITQSVYDRSGHLWSTVTADNFSVSGDNALLVQHMHIQSPELWSPDSPALYSLETLIRQGSEVVDCYYTPFGIRKIEVSPDFGFRLNGECMLLKGVSDHEDGGGAVGAAIPDDYLYYRLQRLKEIGCNAVRTAHNPYRPELYMYCDMLGLMVLDEAFDGWTVPKHTSKYDYGRFFTKWWSKDLGNMVRRDRNHPSVVLWGIGNEVNSYEDEWQTKLANLVRRLDPSRPITQARGVKGPSIDISGFNSEGEKRGVFEKFHEEFPHRPILGTEEPHTRQTRGVYKTQSKHPDSGPKGDKFGEPHLSDTEVFTDVPNCYCSSYDNHYMSINVRENYKRCLRLPYLMGSFRWTGFDYLGEANYKWPTRSYDKGIFDLAGIAKDHYYLYQSIWTSHPMVHLIPHWTHPGKEGVKIPVVAYSNCNRVELFLDSESLGEQVMGDALQLVWQVPYRSGRLTAIAKDNQGHVLAETFRQTAGRAYALFVQASRTSMRANRQDVVRLEVSVMDKQGILVPEADPFVTFRVDGPAVVLGVDNGDIRDLSPTRFANKCKAFKGMCMALIQAADQKGKVRINVSAPGMRSTTVEVLCF